MKKNKKKVNIDDMNVNKLKKALKITLIICVIIIILEGIYYLHVKNKIERNTIYYDNTTMSIKDNDYYLTVGSGYFKDSEFNDFTDGIEKAKFTKIDENNKTIFEIKYDKGINSTFTSVTSIEDGYIVTGSGEYSDYQTENKIRDAILIKYDKNGNVVWEKTYTALSDTRFNKAIIVEDGIVVVGTSIYEDMEVGNHSTGGGIIVKYDFDGNEIWHNNHGGNKSGCFNGIVEVDGNFYVTGKDGADSGNIVKFDSKGEYVWHKNYSYTDGEGLKDITYYNKKLYVVGSKKILEDETAEERKTDNTDGVILEYDLKGNLINEITFGGSSFERFNSLVVLNDNFYISGLSASTDIEGLELKLEKSDATITSGIVVKYDKDLNVVNKIVLGGTKNDQMLKIQLEGNNVLVSGFSNSKDGTIKTKKSNGKDYFGKTIELDENLNINVIR